MGGVCVVSVAVVLLVYRSIFCSTFRIFGNFICSERVHLDDKSISIFKKKYLGEQIKSPSGEGLSASMVIGRVWWSSLAIVQPCYYRPQYLLHYGTCL